MFQGPVAFAKPVPLSDEITAPYWEYANAETLAIQRCQRCRTFHQPPVSLCPVCKSTELCYEPVSGNGTIQTYTITHHARTPAFIALVPYAIVWVELDEQPGLLVVANMPDTPRDQVDIGVRVEVWFEEIAAGTRLPQFRPAVRQI